MKLSKYYWTLQDYQWKQGKCKMIVNTNHKLRIVENGQTKETPHLQANKTRALVGFPINLCHKEAQIATMFTEKAKNCIDRLVTSSFRPGDIMFGHQHCWWPSLKYPSPVLSFAPNLNVLDKLHEALLPKLGVMKTFPSVMRSVPAHLGGLDLHLAEVEALAQVMHHFISLHEADTPTRLLLQILMEYHQLELGSDKQLFILSFDNFGHLTTKTWIASLWQHASHFHLQLALPPLTMNIVQQDGDNFIAEVAHHLGFQQD